MKKFLFILFLFIGTLSYGQTTFTQTFVDRCTGDVKVVVANFVNGSATVAFYDKVRTFTYQQYVSGELQQWLTETYLWWESLSPCSTATTENQNAQQTAQNATSAAQSAANAASSTPPPNTSGTSSTPPPNTDSTATNNTTGGNTNASSSGTGSTESQSTNQNTNTENTNQSDTTSSESSQTETGGGSESTETSQDTSSSESTESQSTETEDTSQETSGEVENTESSESESTETESTEETSSEESSSEETSEESTEESTEEESTEESAEEESSESDEESSEEETEEESKEEESEEDSEEESDDEEKEEDSDEDSEETEEEKKEKKKMLPIQLRADMMANQSLLGNYDIVTSIGATQSSIYGDETYGATAMIWSNLRQFSLNGSYTKVRMQKFDVTSINHQTHKHHKKGNKVTSKDPQQPPVPKVSIVTSASLGYMNNFGNGTFVASMMKIKPTKYGTFGVGVNMINMFGENKYQMTLLGYNVLYTNVINVSPRIQYAPALIWSQSPYMGKIRWERDEYHERYLTARNDLKGTRIHGMAILSNSFTIQLTRRFSINTGATFIKSTNKDIPLIKSFTIGTKLPF